MQLKHRMTLVEEIAVITFLRFSCQLAVIGLAALSGAELGFLRKLVKVEVLKANRNSDRNSEKRILNRRYSNP